MINVTKPFLPPREEYQQYVDKIWEAGWLTNHGPLVTELEATLKDYLGVKHFFFVANGTIALQVAIKALKLKGEVITTPFSYVATTSSLVWEGCKPVFADVEADTLTLDPAKVEAAITEHTTGILATHVYGNPCDVDALQQIADKHNLSLIYDGAHAFGVQRGTASLLSFGDISTCSFHATKLFHTVEGGAVITQDDELARLVGLLRNFGHTSPYSFEGAGINGKNSEFHAAMGLCNIRYINDIIVQRKAIHERYAVNLAGKVTFPVKRSEWTHNYAYFPVLFQTEAQLLFVMDHLTTNQVNCRRYFYPSLSGLDYVDHYNTPVCDQATERVLCLPVFHDITNEEIDHISQLISQALTNYKVQ